MTHREQRLDPVGVDKLQNGCSNESSFSHCAFLIIPPFCRGFRATRMGIQPSSMNNVSLYMTFIMPMPLTAKKRQSSRVYLKRHRAGRLSLDPVPCVKSFAKVHRQTEVWCSRHNFRSGSTLHGSWIDIVASQPSIEPRPKFDSACDYQYETRTLSLSLVKRRKKIQLVPKFAVSSFSFASRSSSSYASYEGRSISEWQLLNCDHKRHPILLNLVPSSRTTTAVTFAK